MLVDRYNLLHNLPECTMTFNTIWNLQGTT